MTHIVPALVLLQNDISCGVPDSQVLALHFLPHLPPDHLLLLLLLLLLCSLQNDISCGVPESQVLALRFLPHLPPDHLLQLLDKG